MNSTNNELFEAYFFGHLTPDDKAKMEQRMADEPSFAAEFETFRTIIEGVLDHQLANTKDELDYADAAEEELIDRYLHQELSAKEKQTLELRIANDLAFAARVEQQSKINNLFINPLNQEIAEQVRAANPILKTDQLSWEKGGKQVEIVPGIVNFSTKKNYRIWIAAASVLILLGLGWWLMSHDSGQQNWPVALLLEEDQLQYNLKQIINEADNNQLGAAPSGTSDNENWVNASRALLEGNAAEAEQWLRSYQTSTPDQPIVKIRLAKALLAQRPLDELKVAQAIDLLHQAKADLEKAGKPPSQNIAWTMAVAEYSQHATHKQGKRKLKAISQDNHSPYQEAAKKMLGGV